MRDTCIPPAKCGQQPAKVLLVPYGANDRNRPKSIEIDTRRSIEFDTNNNRKGNSHSYILTSIRTRGWPKSVDVRLRPRGCIHTSSSTTNKQNATSVRKCIRTVGVFILTPKQTALTIPVYGPLEGSCQQPETVLTVQSGQSDTFFSETGSHSRSGTRATTP